MGRPVVGSPVLNITPSSMRFCVYGDTVCPVQVDGTTGHITLGRALGTNAVLQITPAYARFCVNGGACTLQFDGNSGNITASGSLTLSGSVNATGSITTQNTLTANGAITTNSTITANGAITTNSSITAKGDITTYKNIYLIADPGNTMFGNIESQNEWSLKRGTGLRIRRNLSGGPGINFAHALAIGESPNYNDLQIYTVGAGTANIYKPSGDLIIGDQSQGTFGNVPSKVVLVSDGNGAAGDRGNSLEVGPDGIIFHFYKSPPATTAQVDRVRPASDGLMYLGSPSQRWANIHLNLPHNPNPSIFIVNNDPDGSSLAFIPAGISVVKTAGSCTFTFTKGLMTAVSGC